MNATKHGYLVQRAARWLRGTRKCAVVATEKVPGHIPLVPDAMGWTRDGYSVNVECKMSRADFFADRRKPSVQCGIALGDERWYMTPPGVLTAADLPEGFGLLEVHGKSIRKVVKATLRGRTLAERAETIMLVLVAWHAVGHHFGRRGEPSITRHDAPADAMEAAQ